MKRSRSSSTFLAIAAVTATLAAGAENARAVSLAGRIRAADGVAAPAPLPVAVDSWVCAPGGTVADPKLRISADRGLADVVVRVASPEGAPPYPAQGEVLLDQAQCVFRPHVVVVAPGQDLRVRNGDPILHNFRTAAAVNKPANRAQVKGKEDVFRFATPEIIVAECDVHYWMSAVVVVAPSAWTAVTAEDGSFKLEGLPSGSYTLDLWHQVLGTRTEKADVTADGGRLDVEWSPGP